MNNDDNKNPCEGCLVKMQCAEMCEKAKPYFMKQVRVDVNLIEVVCDDGNYFRYIPSTKNKIYKKINKFQFLKYRKLLLRVCYLIVGILFYLWVTK